MLKINNASNFRRTLAGLSLIAAPIAFGSADIIRLIVEGGMEGSEQLNAIATSPGLWDAATVLNMLGLILFVPAVLGLMHLLRERGTVLGHIGGGLALIGVLGFAAHNAGYFGMLGALSRSGLGHETMLQVIESMEGSVSVALYVVMFLLGFQFGPLLLGVGLYRAQAVPRWVAGLVVAGFVLWLVAGFSALSESVAAITAVWMLISSGLGLTGLRLLQMTDRAWEYGPGANEPETRLVDGQLSAAEAGR
ncbi:MAG TPA: DUF4386 family protein [Aggregatilineales bacterium]|nr:DUF4386 family protein [Aggregatilineales bacterium]